MKLGNIASLLLIFCSLAPMLPTEASAGNERPCLQQRRSACQRNESILEKIQTLRQELYSWFTSRNSARVSQTARSVTQLQRRGEGLVNASRACGEANATFIAQQAQLGSLSETLRGFQTGAAETTLQAQLSSIEARVQQNDSEYCSYLLENPGQVL